jgi:hypothetical protein
MPSSVTTQQEDVARLRFASTENHLAGRHAASSLERMLGCNLTPQSKSPLTALKTHEFHLECLQRQATTYENGSRNTAVDCIVLPCPGPRICTAHQHDMLGQHGFR